MIATQARDGATRIVATGNGACEALGTPTIRGRTRPFRLDRTGNAAHAVGHADLVAVRAPSPARITEV